MDQRAGEKDESNSQDSSDHRSKDDADAAAEVGNHGESMDHLRDGVSGGHEAEKITAGVGVLKEVGVEVVVIGSEEEASAPPRFLAHLCSLLQLLLRACAGCLGLHGSWCSDDDDDDTAAPAVVAESPQEGDRQGGSEDKAASPLQYYVQEVVTRVWAVRRPAPPGRPREGPGGNGGNHN